MNEYLLFGSMLGIALILIGILKVIAFLKKRNLVQCTGCNEIMNKKDFEEHRRTYHNLLGPKERMILFKSWLKTQYDQNLVKNLDDTIKEGCKIADISIGTARRIINNIATMNLKSSKEITCLCCGYVGDQLNIKPCSTCKNLFCQPCMLDHPCFEGKSNQDRVPSDKIDKDTINDLEDERDRYF